MTSIDPPAATTAAEPTRLSSLLALLGRHQIASVISTTVDFGTMMFVVEVLHRSAVVGTLAGATAGALTNFQLGRRWIFNGAHEGAVVPQMIRYGMVSAASAGLNALGEWAVSVVLGMYYVAARAIVAVAVSLLWNFPMQRYFVFRHRKAAA